MYPRRFWLALLIGSGVLAALDAAPTVQITGAVKQSLTLTAEDLAKLPRATVKTTSSGVETVYEGVWFHEVLKRADAPQGAALRGKAPAGYVLAEAQPLFGAQGRFRLVAPKDKPGGGPCGC